MSDYVLPANAPLPGEMFAERYRIDRILGVGGMGFVVAATHVHLHEKVAIKMLLPELASNKQTVERFLREGRAAVKIRSEHVARVLDVGELAVDRTPYLVMEYLDGCDLALYLESEGKVEPEKAVAWVLEACEAIAEAHAMKTVHRDLKPANLFLAQQPNGSAVIKVLDFGISKMTGVEKANLSMTKTSAMLGSPLYMSPEQLRSARNVDERSDIWSIGVIPYELMVGHPPFFAETLAELGALVLTGDTPRVIDEAPHVPVGLSDVIATCMQKNADDRFVNLADLASAIAPYGGEGAAESAQNILKTLGGVPSSRALVQSRSSRTSQPSLTPFARTQPMMPVRPPEASGFGVTSSSGISPFIKKPFGGLLAVVFGFAVIAIGAGVLVYKNAQIAPATASTVIASQTVAPPPASTTAETAASASAPASGLALAPVPSVAVSSPPKPASVSRPTTVAPTQTTAVVATVPSAAPSAVVTLAPSASTQPPPKIVQPSQIATGSKD